MITKCLKTMIQIQSMFSAYSERKQPHYGAIIQLQHYVSSNFNCGPVFHHVKEHIHDTKIITDDSKRYKCDMVICGS